jgi:hypothetical protein
VIGLALDLEATEVDFVDSPTGLYGGVGHGLEQRGLCIFAV